MMSRRMKTMTLMTGAVFAALGASSTALGDFTNVNEPIYNNEPNHLQILEGIYGGVFRANGLDYTNDVISAIRVMDNVDDADPTNLGAAPNGKFSDAMWTGGVATMTAKARFAGKTQSFGYVDTNTNEYTTLFDLTGNQFEVGGSAEVDLSNLTYMFARENVGGGDRFFSQAGENVDGFDHLVTYQITGLDDGRVTWLLFWEDTAEADGILSDFDYNDLVVEISAIPGPPAILAIAAGLGCLGRRRRRD